MRCALVSGVQTCALPIGHKPLNSGWIVQGIMPRDTYFSPYSGTFTSLSETIHMLDNLTQRLSRVVKTMRGEARLTEANTQDMLREVRMALLEADVALPVVRDFVARVKENALGQEVVGRLNPGPALVGVVHKDRKSKRLNCS